MVVSGLSIKVDHLAKTGQIVIICYKQIKIGLGMYFMKNVGSIYNKEWVVLGLRTNEPLDKEKVLICEKHDGHVFDVW